VKTGELIDAACARTGLDDFGGDSWREGLEVLVRSTNEEGALNELGDSVVAGQYVDPLAKRLEVEEWYRRHPEIDDQEIVAPLFGLSLPRTGSTALSFLLALDPARRSLRTWEAAQPAPPPETATEHTDPRIAAAQAGIDLSAQMFPDFVGMLPSSATGPQECLFLLALEFKSQLFEGSARIPSYHDWLFACDMEPAYRYHQRVLKLLQWRCPPTRWWLKTPSHMHAPEALDRVYPDARFVMTHRDIASVIPSVCAVMFTLSKPLTEDPDPAYWGRHNTEMWDVALHRAMAFRDAGAEHRFFDIGFGDMQVDPIGAVRRLYEWLGEELTPVAGGRMAEWWDANSRERQGARRYNAEEFGLDTDALRARFRFYTERFNVPADRR
jgi:hypothetical protein